MIDAPEKPDTVHGRLLESVHISGYSFERAFDELKWLLEEDRWMECGDGYERIDDFLTTIRFEQFKIAAESRKELSRLLSEKRATQRAIAGTLGVGQATVGRDLEPDGSKKTYEKPIEHSIDLQPEPFGSEPAPAFAKSDDYATFKETVETQQKRQAKERERQEREADNAVLVENAERLEDVVGCFGCIVADPPWSWDDEGDISQLGRGNPVYATMGFDELVALPVADLAEGDAHIYLWITNRSVYKGVDLLKAWGFRYVTMLTWPKPSMGMGNYFRGQTEHIMFGVRGSLPLKRKDVPTLLPAWKRGPNGHSSKPLEIYDFVESCSYGPYLEMFSRGSVSRKGWRVWGAEVSV